MSGAGRVLRSAAVPLFWYYAVALLVPLRQLSKLASSQFIEHAVFVVLIPLALVGLVAFSKLAFRRRGAPATKIRAHQRSATKYRATIATHLGTRRGARATLSGKRPRSFAPHRRKLPHPGGSP